MLIHVYVTIMPRSIRHDIIHTHFIYVRQASAAVGTQWGPLQAQQTQKDWTTEGLVAVVLSHDPYQLPVLAEVVVCLPRRLVC